jgi:hypothetical protein
VPPLIGQAMFEEHGRDVARQDDNGSSSGPELDVPPRPDEQPTEELPALVQGRPARRGE